jgi:hypothetical protein
MVRDMRKYQGFPKHNPNEVDPWDGGLTPTLILGTIESEEFRAADRAGKIALLTSILREHDESRDRHEQTVRMVERAVVPLHVRMRRRWNEQVYGYDRYTSYGTRGE